MSEKVRLRSLGEKVNLTLFHEIVGFILETASATLEQTRDLANRCLLFNPVQQKPALQEKYGVLYLGELLERYEERFGMY